MFYLDRKIKKFFVNYSHLFYKKRHLEDKNTKYSHYSFRIYFRTIEMYFFIWIHYKS
jgi:hypothetical protein